VNPFVLIALVAAVLTAALLAVVIRELLRNVKTLTGHLRATSERLVPLTDELQAELAVTSVEVETLTKSVERVQRERSTRAKQHRPRRKR
jgi:uncharacterized protein YlxW (UPF0749 family)